MPLASPKMLEGLLRTLIYAPRAEALGAAVSLLLDAAEKDPGQLQAVLQMRASRVIHGKFQERSIIDVLASVARGSRS